MWSLTQKMWLILLLCLRSVAHDIQDLSAGICGELLAEGRKDALLPWEDTLAESTALCKALGEFAKLPPSPEDVGFSWIYLFFTEFNPPFSKCS